MQHQHVSYNLFSLVFFLFAFHFLTNATASMSAPDLINEICSKTTNVRLCRQILSPRGQPSATNLRDLARVALKLTKSGFQNAYSLISSLLKSSSKNPTLKNRYSSCLDYYNDGITNLKNWEQFLNSGSGSYNKLPTTAISVSIQPVYCDQNFAVAPSEPSQLIAASQKLQDLCSIINVISNSLANNSGKLLYHG